MDKSIVDLRVSHGTVYNFVSHETKKTLIYID
ncbi:hypothetical protein LCGC14_1518760 [marine sediment metagenome]|uniref:Uncharacterized protein n=1 Tax=marine sediment metagenome TaxID=412755 RepID=A0A0F9IZ99_9ZZZZ